MARKPLHHPPEPGAFAPPTSETPGYIMGEQAVAGFGVRAFYVARIPCREAREIIRRHHYSRREVKNSYVHLGVFLDGARVGALQFGYALNPRRGDRVVAGTGVTEYLELNRMWLSDAAPRNSESRALSFAIKYIRRVMPLGELDSVIRGRALRRLRHRLSGLRLPLSRLPQDQIPEA